MTKTSARWLWTDISSFRFKIFLFVTYTVYTQCIHIQLTKLYTHILHTVYTYTPRLCNQCVHKKTQYFYYSVTPRLCDHHLKTKLFQQKRSAFYKHLASFNTQQIIITKVTTLKKKIFCGQLFL